MSSILNSDEETKSGFLAFTPEDLDDMNAVEPNHPILVETGRLTILHLSPFTVSGEYASSLAAFMDAPQPEKGSWKQAADGDSFDAGLQEFRTLVLAAGHPTSIFAKALVVVVGTYVAFIRYKLRQLWQTDAASDMVKKLQLKWDNKADRIRAEQDVFKTFGERAGRWCEALLKILLQAASGDTGSSPPASGPTLLRMEDLPGLIMHFHYATLSPSPKPADWTARHRSPSGSMVSRLMRSLSLGSWSNQTGPEGARTAATETTSMRADTKPGEVDEEINAAEEAFQKALAASMLTYV